MLINVKSHSGTYSIYQDAKTPHFLCVACQKHIMTLRLILEVLVLYIWNPNSIITEPANGLAPIGARPSAGTVMITKIDIFYVVDYLVYFSVIRKIILNFLQDVSRIFDTQRHDNESHLWCTIYFDVKTRSRTNQHNVGWEKDRWNMRCLTVSKI